MRISTTQKTVLISLSLHGLGLYLFNVLWVVVPPSLNNRDASMVLQSHVYQMKSIESVRAHDMPLKQITQKKPEIVVKPKIKPQQKNQSAQKKISHDERAGEDAPSSSSPSMAGAHQDELLTKLHAAIQAAQVYPDSALQMGRYGTAKVEFILQPTGDIEAIYLSKSSGTRNLDEAALHAIGAISPFVLAKEYLKNARKFTIDVVFEI